MAPYLEQKIQYESSSTVLILNNNNLWSYIITVKQDTVLN